MKLTSENSISGTSCRTRRHFLHPAGILGRGGGAEEEEEEGERRATEGSQRPEGARDCPDMEAFCWEPREATQAAHDPASRQAGRHSLQRWRRDITPAPKCRERERERGGQSCPGFRGILSSFIILHLHQNKMQPLPQIAPPPKQTGSLQMISGLQCGSIKSMKQFHSTTTHWKTAGRLTVSLT